MRDTEQSHARVEDALRSESICSRKGSAADAMVATNLCVGVVGMYHSGIGGGGFMLVRDKAGRKEALDYRERAPASAHRDMFAGNDGRSERGGLAVGVPGELRGLEYIHNKYGVLPWSTVVTPAVQLAREGFEVGEDTMKYLNFVINNGTAFGGNGTKFLVEDPNWKEDFAPNGKLVKRGDRLTRKRYANTLEKIAQQGPGAFYEGEIADSIISLVRASNGTMAYDDLKNYTVIVREPLSVSYRSFNLFTTGAPSSGAVVLSVLKILEQYPPPSDWSPLTYHRLVEAMKFAYGARMSLGDPSFAPNISLIESQMLCLTTANSTRHKINDSSTLPDMSAYNPLRLTLPENHGTSHIVATDGSGLTLSSTTTINLLFGAQIMTPDTGIILNDQMDDFSIPSKNDNAFGFPPSPSNYIHPHARPLSSITPIIAEHASNSSLYLAIGAAGGSRIISCTAQILYRLLEPVLLSASQTLSPLESAMSAPRLHDQAIPPMLYLEDGDLAFPRSLFDALEAKNHNVTWGPAMTAVQALMRHWNGSFEAVSETRQKDSGGLSF